MARIAGVNIPTNKRVEIALTYIHGIGRTTAKKIIAKLGIAPEKRVQDLTDQEVLHIREAIDRDHKVEGDLPPPAAMVLVDRLADVQHLLVGKVLDALLGRNAELLGDLLGRGPANSVDVGQRDFDALVRGDVDPGNTSHSLPFFKLHGAPTAPSRR